MYKFNSMCCMPPDFYRTPERIKDDIRKISARINEINGMLNIRELLADFLGEDSDSGIAERAAELSELLAYATEALDELIELNNTLDGLKEELSRVIYIIGT